MQPVKQVPFQIDTFKSLATDKQAADGIINYQIGGYISTEQLDKQNEVVIQKGIDFETYKAHRRLKWEHDPSPKSNIGFAENIELRKGGRTYMSARIFATPGTPQYKVAEEAVGDIRNILAYNAQYPNNPKTLGFSVEGGKLQKSGTNVTKSVVTNVVLTTCPINTGAIVDFFKSFMAGNQVVDLTGTPALRPEHLDGNLSNHIKNKMKDLKTKDEALTFYKSQGKSEDDAKRLADQWEAEHNNRLDITKSINSAVERLEKAVVDNTAIETKLGAVDYEAMTKSLKNSCVPNAENQLNPGLMMVEAANLQVELAKSQLSRDAEIIKSNGLVLNAVKENISLMKSFADSLNQVKDDNSVIIESNDELAKSLAKIDTGLSTEKLGDEKIAGEGVETGAGEGSEKPKYTREQVVHALQKSAMDLYDKGNRNESDQYDAWLIKAQAFNYNLSAKEFPVEIATAVEDFYRAK